MFPHFNLRSGLSLSTTKPINLKVSIFTSEATESEVNPLKLFCLCFHGLESVPWEQSWSKMVSVLSVADLQFDGFSATVFTSHTSEFNRNRTSQNSTHGYCSVLDKKQHIGSGTIFCRVKLLVIYALNSDPHLNFDAVSCRLDLPIIFHHHHHHLDC